MPLSYNFVGTSERLEGVLINFLKHIVSFFHLKKKKKKLSKVKTELKSAAVYSASCVFVLFLFSAMD